MNSAIRTEHREKKFHRVEALRDLNLDVPTGAIYALVGPNGAGKTTAIKILMNIPGDERGAEVLGTDFNKLVGRANVD
jgi:ABC-type multidrug transport system ATPase subunit